MAATEVEISEALLFKNIRFLIYTERRKTSSIFLFDHSAKQHYLLTIDNWLYLSGRCFIIAAYNGLSKKNRDGSHMWILCGPFY